MNAQPSNLALNTVEPSVAPIGRMLIASAIMTIAVPKVAGVRRIKAPFPRITICMLGPVGTWDLFQEMLPREKPTFCWQSVPSSVIG